MRRRVDGLEIADIFYKLKPHHLATVEKPGKFSLAFLMIYSEVLSRSTTVPLLKKWRTISGMTAASSR